MAIGPLPCRIAGKSVEAMSFLAIGSAWTWMVSAAAVESTVPSLALNVNESLPWKLVSGVYVYYPFELTTVVPWVD